MTDKDLAELKEVKDKAVGELADARIAHDQSIRQWNITFPRFDKAKSECEAARTAYFTADCDRIILATRRSGATND